MIIETLENLNIYISVNSNIKIELDFPETKNLYNLSIGRYENKGDEVYAMVFEYFTGDDDLVLEGHKKNIDIHYMVKGEERVNVSRLHRQMCIKKYSEEEDFHLFSNIGKVSIDLNKGMFVVFNPNELHKPG